MEKIEITKIKRESGMALDDTLRDGIAPTHDRLKLSSLLTVMVNTINELVDKVKEKEKQGGG